MREIAKKLESSVACVIVAKDINDALLEPGEHLLYCGNTSKRFEFLKFKVLFSLFLSLSFVVRQGNRTYKITVEYN